jgi:hypothetical protein
MHFTLRPAMAADDVADQLRRTGQVEGPGRTFEATPVIGESTNAAYLDAEAWLVTAPGE